MRNLVLIGLLSLASEFFSLSRAQAATPFRLLTTESALLPQKRFVLGLQTFGITTGPVFIDTNPLYDLASTANLGLKYARPLNQQLALMVGGRYLKFFGADRLESQIRSSQSRIDRFQLAFQGGMAYAGLSLKKPDADYHVNLQWAEISGSKIFGAVFAGSFPVSELWAFIGEAGYDFANRQPRASLGFTRTGPSFGTRLGLTYIRIDDPFLRYQGVAPILDFFWQVGE